MNSIFPMIREAAAGVFGREPVPDRSREAAKGFAPLLASKLNPRKEAREAPAKAEDAPESPAAHAADAADDSAVARETERAADAPPPREDAAEEARSRTAAEASGEGAARDAAKAAEAANATPAPAAGKGEAGTKTEVVTGAAAVPAEATPAAEVRRADPSRVYRGLDRLDGEFRSRFDRVVARMQDEFGHKVEVVETFRDQARQEMLFQQGRGQPGPVVTWTRQSNHTRGTAADVVIDGGYENAAAFARLAQVAAEEGLRTLGAKDPGHVELPRAGGQPAAAPAAAPAPAAPDVARQRGGFAVPAVPQVAQVARVAEVAVPTVARVAQVARPGAPLAAAAPRVAAAAVEAEIPAAPAPLGPIEITIDAGRETHTAGATVAGDGASGRPDGSRSGTSSDSSGERRGASEERSARAQALSAEASMLAEIVAADPTQSLRAPQGVSGVEAAAPVSGADTASRIARVLDLQESLGALPPTHMLLRVESPSGIEDRIRVDLRGNRVDATLNMGNPGEVGALGSRVEDLVRALERHGLETDTVRIRSAATVTDAVETGRAAAALGDADSLRAAATRGGAESSLNRDRGEGGHPSPRDDQRPRPDADSQQQRSRKQPKAQETA